LLLENASLVIGGDTGPLHLASSLGVPSIGIFGPTDPRRNGPWMSKAAHVTRHSDCTCKYRRRCSARVPCITGITVEEVLGQAIRTVGTLRDPVKA
jgi:ADP-heptose:LPS heptosyltransferase